MQVDNHADVTDEVLAQKLRTDPQFLGDIIERYEQKLSLYLWRKSGASGDDIKDMLQNIFLKVYRNINDFDTTLAFSSWIYRIARNEAIDWYRREKRTPRLSLEASDALLSTIRSDSDTAKLAEEGEAALRIKHALEALPEKYQDVAELRFFEDKSYDEIADILAIPPGTVAIRLSRIKKMLRDSLTPYATPQ